MGETNAILPLMAALAEERPSLSFLLTTGTVTSAKLAAQRLGPRAIHQYAPLDAPEYVQGFLDHWRPDLAVFTESEIWPNLILESSARDIPLALVNGRMTKRSFRRWRRNPSFAHPLFSRFALVLAQNEGLARRFTALGAPNAFPPATSRSTRRRRRSTAELERLRPVLDGRSLLIAASTHDGEDQIIADAHRALAASLPTCAPSSRPAIPSAAGRSPRCCRGRGLKVARRSLGDLPDRTSDAYVADTIGELGMLYKLAPVAFIGGSLVDRGGQNPIEAVRQGAVVLVGPHWQNFADTYRALIKQPRRHRRAFGRGDRQRRPQAALGRGRARQHAHPRQRRACHHLGRAAAHHRGPAALPPERGRPGACVLTSPPGGIANPRAASPRSCSRWARSMAGPPRRAICAPTPYRSRLPVICVGNFTAGGTGKTPLAIHLCERLKAAGHEPVALTRGYGGRLSGPYWVNAKTDVARDVGDEALLLARAAPTLVARDRRAGARAIETGPHPVTVIVMDDGLQNPSARQGPDHCRGRRRPRAGRQRPGDAGRTAAGAARVPARADRRHRRQRARRARARRDRLAAPSLCRPRCCARRGAGRGRRLAEGRARGRLGRHRRAAAVLCHAGGAGRRGGRRRWRFAITNWLGDDDARRLLDLARRHGATLVTTEKDMARLTGAAASPSLAGPRACCT